MKRPWFNIVCELDGDGPRLAPTIRDIQRAVCGRFAGVSINDINSARRTAEIIRPRHIAMYLARHLTLKSYPTIGRAFGCKDHTTVHASVRKMDRLLTEDGSIRLLMASIAAELGVAA